jgi:hypothetical protein
VSSLFHAIHTCGGVDRRAVISALIPLLCEVITYGDGRDLGDLDEVPWAEIPVAHIDRVVDVVIARIDCGAPNPDEFRRFSAAVDQLVEALGQCPSLTSEHAERMYAAVCPATWLLHREERCRQLLALARARRDQ